MQRDPFPPDLANVACGSSGWNVEASGISGFYSSAGALDLRRQALTVIFTLILHSTMKPTDFINRANQCMSGTTNLRFLSRYGLMISLYDNLSGELPFQWSKALCIKSNHFTHTFSQSLQLWRTSYERAEVLSGSGVIGLIHSEPRVPSHAPLGLGKVCLIRCFYTPWHSPHKYVHFNQFKNDIFTWIFILVDFVYCTKDVPKNVNNLCHQVFTN